MRPTLDRRSIRRYGPGDLVAIVLFVVVGELHHNIGPLSAPLAVGETMVPFLMGWILAGPILGAYAASQLSNRRQLLVRSALAWVVAVGIAMGLRATAIFRGEAAPVFAAVALGFGGLFVLTGRFAAFRISRNKL